MNPWVSRPHQAFLCLILWCLATTAWSCAPLTAAIFARTAEERRTYTHGISLYHKGQYHRAVTVLSRLDAETTLGRLAGGPLQNSKAAIQEAEAQTARGLSLRQQGKLAAAKQAFQQALAVYPQNTRIVQLAASLNREIAAGVAYHVTLGDDYFTRKEYDEAKASYLEALRLDKDAANAQGRLHRTMRLLAQQYLAQAKAVAAGRPEAAMPHLENAFRNDPSDPEIVDELVEAYNRRSLRHYREGRLARALQDMKRSLALNPRQPELRREMAEVQKRLGLLKKIEPRR